jgi:hypothetical protein
VGFGRLEEEKLGYFQRNVARLQYATFRKQGFFIGSGVIEAGCKTVIGARCKQSGMFWGVPGATNVLGQSMTRPRVKKANSYQLLEEGVTSVVAMSHSVLVETARRFVQAFYGELAHGARVGRAMLAGQRALHDNTCRGKILCAGDLRLHDWFVPVIYQEEHAPQLITKIPAKDVQHLEARKRQLNLGDLPDEPPHKFPGRSRELLALERLLHRQPWAVVGGTGGQGKTTLAAALARWLTRTCRS